VLVVHEWWGLNEYAKKRVRQLAELGYVAFAADMYGEARQTDDPAKAQSWSGHLRGDVPSWRGRARKGLQVLRRQQVTAKDRLAAIGYCFGGSTVLHLAYTDAPVEAVVSFHGSFPKPGEDADVEASVLVCHGAADPFAKPSKIRAWQQRMDELGADWHMTTYGGARHSFTNPDADDHGVDGVGHHETAARRAWWHMRGFLQRQLEP
jgi:dienelactone hydrolase